MWNSSFQTLLSARRRKSCAGPNLAWVSGPFRSEPGSEAKRGIRRCLACRAQQDASNSGFFIHRPSVRFAYADNAGGELRNCLVPNSLIGTLVHWPLESPGEGFHSRCAINAFEPNKHWVSDTNRTGMDGAIAPLETLDRPGARWRPRNTSVHAGEKMNPAFGFRGVVAGEEEKGPGRPARIGDPVQRTQRPLRRLPTTRLGRDSEVDCLRVGLGNRSRTRR